MSQRVKSVIYYVRQICNIEFEVVSVGAKFMELVFNSTIQMHELRTKIKKKVGGSSQGRITRLQYIFIAFIDPYKYELFDVISETHIKMVILSHILSENTVIELYVEFVDTDGSSPSLTLGASNTGIEVQAKSPTTRLCGRRTNDLLLSTGAAEGTFNTVLEGDNEGVDEEKDTGEKERVADTNKREESELEPIRQRGSDGSEVVLFSKPEPYGFNDDKLDNTSSLNLRFRAYEPSPHMTNLDLSVKGGLKFLGFHTEHLTMQA
ncbi:hypothetical protein PVK06_011757 [Gossypium arboreum]|uniref:HORMA domain-containing protein n=1 Tax=Gossypium arboreum TaxID=29729 RepID=A0ABR0Q9K4_GOSAR|nr:hypothetical protein PVK06_011757 [Gossypium arboreum]